LSNDEWPERSGRTTFANARAPLVDEMPSATARLKRRIGGHHLQAIKEVLA
jgi:hypothetical protein